jgi:hypothetical protein
MRMTKVLGSSAWLTVLYGILLLLLVSGEAFAATYYVSPAGNDVNSGTTTAPFKTIQKAANVVNPGDTVIVKNGVYTDTDGNGYTVYLNRGGTSSAWITIKAENKWGAVLDEQNTAKYGFLLGASADYVRIEDFEIKNARESGIFIGGSSSNTLSYIYIYRNKIHDVGRSQILCTDPTVGNLGRTGSYADHYTSNITYDSNIFYSIGRLEGGCAAHDYSHDHGLYLRTDYLTIINNIFYNCLAGFPIQLDGGASNPGGMHDIDIINNTFYGDNPGSNGHIILWYDVGDITIQNNISHTNGGYFLHNSTQQQYDWPDSYGQGNVYNNLVYGGTVYRYTPTKNWTGSKNIEGKDPKFANLGAYDFHLQEGSPAIDKGVYIAGYEYDADGNPVTGVPDIGAYEYGNTVPPPADVTAPTVPTGLSASAVSPSQINLSWRASIDDVGVAGYKVYRGTSLIATTTKRSYSDIGLARSTVYSYRVSAFDAAGNISVKSASKSATTQP